MIDKSRWRWKFCNLGPKRVDQTVTTDHVVQTFTVTVRSMQRRSVSEIKDAIEKRYEVVSIEEMDAVTFVQ